FEVETNLFAFSIPLDLLFLILACPKSAFFQIQLKFLFFVTRVAWLNRSNILYAGNDKWSIDLRVQLLQYSPSEFSIMISHVDVYDEGLYTCSFQTQDKPHTSQVYLIVHVPARIVNISSAVTVNEGSNVNLLCLAVGKPEPTVIWRQLKDGFTSEGEYLEISEINREQAGEYECITANGVSTQDSKHVLITVNYPPIITDVKDSRPLIGKTALLRCEAMAVPAAEFQWFKDDNRLISGSDGLQIQNERTRSILLFTNVTTRHYGNYTCLASNSLGSYNVSLRLISESFLLPLFSRFANCWGLPWDSMGGREELGLVGPVRGGICRFSELLEISTTSSPELVRTC
uniref:IgLON family member 5 n=1 Tax=Pseudonaja textilis TaxID=8673 RepID=A0A670ZGG5_PSETE